MCMFCNWGSDEIFGEETVVDPEAMAARRRASQDSWNRVMDEIAKADASRSKIAPPPDTD